ncbi:carbohydrate-binding domain-containing protein [Cellulomonas sp. APG4]|uniref:carbohydrate-binding domain-containing protein n=1 Tax=Cellulomonas sp. APG4 TaxID=1538656 RepID=UPI00137A35BE|nr:carbohydrate-binding domain-containing protein [Cellulomonas sp. APG4]NCT90782.1 carbohydrate-binding domain-containing protein [Cellulomonas sp. APG4]
MKRSHLTRSLSLATALALVGACGTTTATSASTSSGTATVEQDAAVAQTAATSENMVDHDEPDDHVWDVADEEVVALDGTGATSSSDAVTVDGGTVTVTRAGTYRVTGTLTDGQLRVSTQDEGIVRLVLDGVDITSTTGSALYVEEADEVVVVLADGTTSTLTDATAYVLADGVDEPNAALFSTADLTLAGSGDLVVQGRSNDAIASKDGLVVTEDPTIEVDAVDDGVRGKDYVLVEGGTLDVTAGGDGLKADEDEDATAGYIQVTDGEVTVTADGDGVDAVTDVLVDGGKLHVTAGGGHTAAPDEEVSTKGLKGGVHVAVAGGTVAVDASDDAVHANGTVSVTGGDLTLASSDDGVHADGTLAVDGAQVTVTSSYEGLEGGAIVVASGEVDVTADDDGLNVAGGADGSGFAGPGGAADGGMPGGGPAPADRPSRDDGWGGDRGPAATGSADDGDGIVTTDQLALTTPRATGAQQAATGAAPQPGDEGSLVISGGTVTVHADGDGLDANGSAAVTGGTVTVHGPTSQGNGALDVDGTFVVSGGTLVAGGSAEMLVTPQGDGQGVAVVAFGSAAPAGATIELVLEDGAVVATLVSERATEAVVVSSPSLTAGTTYGVLVDGRELGPVTAG